MIEVFAMVRDQLTTGQSVRVTTLLEGTCIGKIRTLEFCTLEYIGCNRELIVYSWMIFLQKCKIFHKKLRTEARKQDRSDTSKLIKEE